MSEVFTSLKEWFPNRSVNDPNDFLWCCDASGVQEQSGSAPEIQILRRKYGLRPKFKKVKIPPTIDIVRGFMSRLYRGEPCFLVDSHPSNHLLLDGLNGSYAYPQGEILETTTPDKDNIHDHLMDVVRYLAVNFGGSPERTTNRAAFDKVASADILPPRHYAL